MALQQDNEAPPAGRKKNFERKGFCGKEDVSVEKVVIG